MTTAKAYREAAAKLIALAEEMEGTPERISLGEWAGWSLSMTRNPNKLVAEKESGALCTAPSSISNPASAALCEAQRRAREAGLL